MSDHLAPDNKVDVAVQDILDRIGQRLSRRGVVARLGSALLGALGVTLLPNLPLDRRFVVDAQTGDCATDWQLCGIYGYLCKPCCGNGSGGLTECPSCSARGTEFSWSKCCPEPSTCPPSGKNITYWDCCGVTWLQSECRKAGGLCARNSRQDLWCQGSGYPQSLENYICTIIQVGG